MATKLEAGETRGGPVNTLSVVLRVCIANGLFAALSAGETPAVPVNPVKDLRLLLATESNNLLTLSPGLQPMAFKLINPESLGPARGYSNGVLTEAGGRLLFIAGQVGWDKDQKIVSEDFVEQFDRALANVITVVSEAGGTPDQIARLMLYVTDKKEYQRYLKEVGESYRAHLGKHFPAMVLVEVRSLLDDQAKVEIEGLAVLSS